LLETPEPLVERLWRHELDAAPLRTPEQKAGLRRRLMDHVQAIGDGDVRDQYRADFLKRFNALTLPEQARRPWVPGGRYAPPPRPASQEARAVGLAGLNPQLGRAVLQGLVRFPLLIAEHAEAIAALPLAERDSARLRDLMLESAMTEAVLDPEALNTILANSGGLSLIEDLARKRGLKFSFTRRDAEPERACRDLALAIETLAARPGLDAALEAATARLKDEGDEAAFQEQQRLRTARDEADRQLATLFEADGD
jgi:DNA primase